MESNAQPIHQTATVSAYPKDPNKAIAAALVSDSIGTQAGLGGAEALLNTIVSAWPHMSLYAPLVERLDMPVPLSLMPIHTHAWDQWSWLKKLPNISTLLGPWLMQELDVTSYELVISFHHAWAKSVLVHPKATHVCYCHSPMRYVWDQYSAYQQRHNGFQQLGLGVVAPLFRAWDVESVNRVDRFITNSAFTAQRIHRCYGRAMDEIKVINPPVDVDAFHPAEPEDYFMAIGRLVPYKGFDTAIEVFNRLNKQLFIMGKGPDEGRLRAMAGPSIHFMGHVSRMRYIDLLSRCRGVIHPGVEDFGMAMAEAQACGKPVIAPLESGAADIIEPDVSGLLLTSSTGHPFAPPTVAQFSHAVEESWSRHWDSQLIRQLAHRFSTDRFIDEFYAAVNDVYPTFALPTRSTGRPENHQP